jgi:catalase (peroxidase I)
VGIEEQGFKFFNPVLEGASKFTVRMVAEGSRHLILPSGIASYLINLFKYDWEQKKKPGRRSTMDSGF